MSSRFSNFKKYSAVGIGLSSGIIAFYLYRKREDGAAGIVFNSWTTNTNVSPCAKWDLNWDHRDPRSLVKPLKANADVEDENKFNEKLDAARPKATRHIFLIRHGQYHTNGKTDTARFLTDIGRKQAAQTGERLKKLEIPWTEIIWSTMTRAQETGKIISSSLPPLDAINCSMIEEGAPIAPEPPVGHWRPEPCFFQDGGRIEAAFRKYFYRAEVSQEKDSYTLLVCHANVIRYFVCRALQFPPEAWLRISLNHASITWLSIHPTGRIVLRNLGDSGHMPPELITSR